MDLRQLRYYVHIVELGSITAASQVLHIAQPSLSQHVSNLENELGTALLVRGRNGAQATPAGKILYRHAKTILRQLVETKVAVKQGLDMPAGLVTIGLPTSTARVLAVPLIRAVSEQYPEICLKLVESSTSELAEAIAAQKADLALCVEVLPQAGMHAVPVADEEIMLVVNEDHRGRGEISMREVSELPLILPSFPHSVRVLYHQALVHAGLPLRLVAETSAAGIALAAVAAGLGCTLQPWSATVGWEGAQATRLTVRPLADVQLVRRMSLCMSHGAASSIACLAVEKVLLDLIAGLIRTKAWQGVRLIAAP